MSIDLAWTAAECGGYASPNNPQALLTVAKEADVRIKLERADNVNDGLIYFIYKGNERVTKPDKGKGAAFQSKYLSSKSVTSTFHLPAGDYVVLCCTQKHNPEAEKFTLTADNAKLSALKFTGARVSKTLQFAGEGAGGHGNIKSPQFFLTVTKKTNVSITMKVGEASKGDAVIFWVIKSPKGVAKRHDDFGNEASRVFTSRYLGSNAVDGCIEDVEPGVYIILTMTSKKQPREVELIVDLNKDTGAKLDGAVFEAPKIETKSFDDIVAKGRYTAKIGSFEVPAYTVTDAHKIVDQVNKACKGAESFADKTFGRDEKSLNNCPNAKKELDKCDWQRPLELTSEPVLFSSGATADDIAQGSVGNCWFCACISALAGARETVVTRLFYPPTYNPRGIYAVNVFIDGEWRAVLIDDFLPTKNGNLAFAHSGSRTEFWFAFIEKAFAKIAGCYQQMMGSAMPGAFGGALGAAKLFSGGSGHRLTISADKVDEWWPTLHEYAQKRWMCSTASRGKREKPGNEKVDDTGLVIAHAYTVVRAVDAPSKHRMVQVRNTWGRTEWTGDWADGHELWTDWPQVAKACGVDSKAPPLDDGMFWMSAKDFATHYEYLNLVKFVEDEMPHSTKHEGQWTADSYKSSANVSANPQFLLSFDKPGANINLQLKAHATEKVSIRFFLFELPDGCDGTAPIFSSSKEAFFTSRYVSATSVDAEIKLPSDARKVVFVPLSTAESTFSIILSSSEKATIAPIAGVKTVSVDDRWAGDRVGKYKHAKSPRVRIELKKASNVDLKLGIADDMEKQGIQMVVEEGGPSDKWPAKTVAETKFTTTKVLSLALNALPAGTYTAWVTTHKPAEGKFTLKATATVDVKLTPL